MGTFLKRPHFFLLLATKVKKIIILFGSIALICLFLVILLVKTSLSFKPKVYIQKLPNGHYRLMVDRKPFVVKGVCYNPIPVGQSHDYDWWSDPTTPWIKDGKLMQDMGVNTIRLYQGHENSNEVKRVIRELYQLYGIRTIMGDWLGFWEYPCPFYADKVFRDKVKKQVLEMVTLYKDEPGILLWILGNENNYSCFGRVNPWSSDDIDKETDLQQKNYLRAKIYYSFVNELAREIHKIDPNHPVALGNGELVGLDIANKVSPDIDLVACIIYRGRSFGNLFQSLKSTFDLPVLLSEFGADSYDAFLNKEDQNMQAFFLEAQWRQIYENLADGRKGAGNCIGGAMFEWLDEWWKYNPSEAEGHKIHNTQPGWSSGSYYFDIKAPGNMNMNEEWFGIVAQSEKSENGLNKRIPKKAYYVVREFWKNPSLTNTKKRVKK